MCESLKTVEELIRESQDAAACDPEPVSTYFGLSYAHYLVVPRLALETMSPEWQRRFVKCLYQLCDAIDFVPEGCEYHVQLKDAHTHRCVSLSRDPLNDYRRGHCEMRPYANDDPTWVFSEHEGPSSNGRTPGCEPGEAGSIPAGPSELTVISAREALASLNEAFRRLALDIDVDFALRRLDVKGEINHLKNWLGTVAEMFQAGEFCLRPTAWFKIARAIERIKELRRTNRFYEVW